jgi:hypothetical protein
MGLIMPQIKEEFVGFQLKYNIYTLLAIRVLFWGLISRHNIFNKLEYKDTYIHINTYIHIHILTYTYTCIHTFNAVTLDTATNFPAVSWNSLLAVAMINIRHRWNGIGVPTQSHPNAASLKLSAWNTSQSMFEDHLSSASIFSPW